MYLRISRRQFLASLSGWLLCLLWPSRRLPIPADDPPVLTTIEISPPSVTMQVNEQRTFMATGKDQYGNPYPISHPRWEASGGTFTPNGTTCTYTALAVGDFQISCRQEGTLIQGTAAIHTDPASQLTTIELSPESVTMRVNEQRTFTATGKDQYGNPYTISDPVWTTSGRGTLSPNGTTCTYTATSTGDYTITCRQNGTSIQGSATIRTDYRIYLPLILR